MLLKLLIAWLLMAACVTVHAGGITGALRWVRRASPPQQALWSWTWLLIRSAGGVVLLHLVEIAFWAMLYYQTGAMPDLQSAFYFSGVTYTTTGYGDLVLPKDWRLIGGIEALTGILMCGWSTGFFFAVVARMHEAQKQGKTAPA